MRLYPSTSRFRLMATSSNLFPLTHHLTFPSNASLHHFQTLPESRNLLEDLSHPKRKVVAASIHDQPYRKSSQALASGRLSPVQKPKSNYLPSQSQKPSPDYSPWIKASIEFEAIQEAKSRSLPSNGSTQRNTNGTTVQIEANMQMGSITNTTSTVLQQRNGKFFADSDEECMKGDAFSHSLKEASSVSATEQCDIQDFDEATVKGDSISHFMKEASTVSATERCDMQVSNSMPVKIDKAPLSTSADGTREAQKASQLQQNIKNKKKVSNELACSLEEILIVQNLDTAKDVVSRLRGEYKNHVHACDTEVTDIDLKNQSPINHGKITCFSIYCGSDVNFGSGKTCIWVDVLDGGIEVLDAFKEYFEDSSIKKVWHNYSFDRHILYNYGIEAKGFYADTMHLARLWNSGRTHSQGGYSLESLTSDWKVMDGVHGSDPKVSVRKTSMKDLFGIANVKKDGTEGKLKVIPPVMELQRDKATRGRWICYSSSDAVCTWKLWESLKAKLGERDWSFQKHRRTMYAFYQEYWRPFGELLVEIESAGMLVDRCYLEVIEKHAIKQQNLSVCKFRTWAAEYCPDARYLNLSSDSQIRQLLYGGCNLKGQNKVFPMERQFFVPNIDGYVEEGKKVAKKKRAIIVRGTGVNIPVIKYTESGLPAVSADVLKALAGKVSVDYSVLDEEGDESPIDLPESGDDNMPVTSSILSDYTSTAGNNTEEDLSLYGEAYKAFGGGKKGKDACQAIASLYEVSTIDTLISSFIKKLQGSDVVGKDGRIHCSINLNTETGRLSARRPNLQNQPALDKDRYKIRQAFIATRGNSLIVADYEQLELRILAHLSNCSSMIEAFRMGGDFHSRTAMNMYGHVRKAVENGTVLLEWEPKPGEDTPPVPLLKDIFAAERRKAKMLNFSIAYGKTAIGLSKDWKVSVKEAESTVELWYKDKQEVRLWQDERKIEARERQCVYTLLGRPRHFPDVRKSRDSYLCGHIERAAINTPVQGSAADVAMCAMLEIARNQRLKHLGWELVLQVHDEVILEGPTDSAEEAKDIVAKAMSYPFDGKNILQVDLAVDANFAKSWYDAK